MTTQPQQPTDTELKQILAKMSPGKVIYLDNYLCWMDESHGHLESVLDSELLSLCREVALNLDIDKYEAYRDELKETCLDDFLAARSPTPFECDASWQQRIMATVKA